MKGFIQFAGLCFLAWAVFFGYKIYQGWGIDEQNLKDHPCLTDWKQCKDVKDLIQNNFEARDARSACKMASEDLGQFGPPEWHEDFGYTPFPIYYTDNVFKKTGFLVISDDRSLLPNQYGGKERELITCSFDLEKNKVDSVRMPNLQ